ncbi:chemotaxis protein CheX [Caulobacter soli]|uniref:chemotaxis protein CheX n=1 Tax=Caulobacter soli TaxID=2708539 RepID=UPI0013EADD02|nr:chemotaxis protein CheX [Caulobacter soli]
MLSDIENDALTELVNIAVSGAAVRLRAMVGAEVKLTVPAVSIVDGVNAVRTMEALGLTSVMAVRQSFSGRLFGETMLVFPEENYGDLIRAVLGADMPEADVEALTTDALGEIGNVLLLGFLSTIGAMLDVQFQVSIPTVAIARPEEIFAGDANQVALFIYVNFSISGREVRGYFGLVLGLATFAILQRILAAFIVKVT